MPEAADLTLDDREAEVMAALKQTVVDLMKAFVARGGRQTLRDTEGVIQFRSGRRVVTYKAKLLERILQSDPTAYWYLAQARARVAQAAIESAEEAQ